MEILRRRNRVLFVWLVLVLGCQVVELEPCPPDQVYRPDIGACECRSPFDLTKTRCVGFPDLNPEQGCPGAETTYCVPWGMAGGGLRVSGERGGRTSGETGGAEPRPTSGLSPCGGGYELIEGQCCHYPFGVCASAYACGDDGCGNSCGDCDRFGSDFFAPDLPLCSTHASESICHFSSVDPGACSNASDLSVLEEVNVAGAYEVFLALCRTQYSVAENTENVRNCALSMVHNNYDVSYACVSCFRCIGDANEGGVSWKMDDDCRIELRDCAGVEFYMPM